MKVLKRFCGICHNITSELCFKTCQIFQCKMVSHNVLFWCGYELREMPLFSPRWNWCVCVKRSWHSEDGLLEKGGEKSRVSEAIAILLPQRSAERQLERGPYIQGWQEEAMSLETLKGRRKGAWCPWERKLMWCRWPPPKSPNRKAVMKEYLKGERALQAYWKVNRLRQDRSPQRDIYISLKINSESLMVIVSGPWLLFILIYPPVLIW